jgi:hypothetical protein
MGISSDIDKEILKVLLTPDEKYSSTLLSDKFGVPRSIIERRRKRLETFHQGFKCCCILKYSIRFTMRLRDYRYLMYTDLTFGG